MAAAAYDVAALALRGSDAVLNFPDSVKEYPRPPSASPADIRSAATAAAAMREARDREAAAAVNELRNRRNVVDVEYVDMEAVFDMPNLLADMAEGMMVSPPRMCPTPAEEADDLGGGDRLWSYY